MIHSQTRILSIYNSWINEYLWSDLWGCKCFSYFYFNCLRKQWCSSIWEVDLYLKIVSVFDWSIYLYLGALICYKYAIWSGVDKIGWCLNYSELSYCSACWIRRFKIWKFKKTISTQKCILISIWYINWRISNYTTTWYS